MRNLSITLAISVVLTLLMGVSSAQATVIITATETGGDVVFNGSGSLNFEAWTYQGSFPGTPYISPSISTIVVGPEGTPEIDNYQNPSNYLPPVGFGSGFNTNSDFGSGDIFGIDRGMLQVPAGYTSEDPLEGSSTYNGQTFASLGMELGSYTWSWGGTGNPADSITLNVVPEPSTALLFGLGLVGLGVRRRVTALS